MTISDDIYNFFNDKVDGIAVSSKTMNKYYAIMLSSESCHYCFNIKEKVERNNYTDFIKIIDIDKLLDSNFKFVKEKVADNKNLNDIIRFIESIRKVPFFIWKDKNGINFAGNYSFDKILRQINNR